MNNRNLEIERKFLVKDSSWKNSVSSSVSIEQGYLIQSDGSKLRVRIVSGDPRSVGNRFSEHLVEDSGISSLGYLTIKVNLESEKFTRLEYESTIEISLARTLLEKCPARIIKTRYFYYSEDHVFSIDEFINNTTGEVYLTLCEVELKSEDEEVSLPSWIGVEVSQDPRYFNSNMIK